MCQQQHLTTVDVNEITCPHCSDPNVELALSFDPVSALADQGDVAQKKRSSCGGAYEIAREVSVSYEIIPEALEQQQSSLS